MSLSFNSPWLLSRGGGGVTARQGSVVLDRWHRCTIERATAGYEKVYSIIYPAQHKYVTLMVYRTGYAQDVRRIPAVWRGRAGLTDTDSPQLKASAEI